MRGGFLGDMENRLGPAAVLAPELMVLSPELACEEGVLRMKSVRNEFGCMIGSEMTFPKELVVLLLVRPEP